MTPDEDEIWDDLGDLMKAPWDASVGEVEPEEVTLNIGGDYPMGAMGTPQEVYPDYRASETSVLSGPLGAFHFPGRRFANWGQVLAWAEGAGWAVRETIRTVRGRWIIRVSTKEGDE